MAEERKKTSKELLKRPIGPTVPIIRELKPLKTYKVHTSSVLSKVKSFLPSLAQANVDLNNTIKSYGQDNVIIEENKDDSKCIEMDVAIIEYESEDEEDSDIELSLPCQSIKRTLEIEELK